MSLETELRALAVDWPETPRFDLPLERRRSRLPLVAALAAAALAAALAVPQSRGAILRFLHVGGATVRFVDTLPRAEARPLADGLGPVLPRDAARRLVPGLLLPPLDPAPPLHGGPGELVSLVFAHDGRPVLLSELSGGVYLKKLLAGETRADAVAVGGAPGFWIAGARHVVSFPRRSPRLAGSVLLWARAGTTYRLEGPGLTRAGALALAQSLRKG